jgi:hypothetical protein
MNTKKVFAVSVLAMVVAGAVFGQEGKTWYNSYAEGVDQKVLVNVGVGLGPTGGYDLGVPPLSASVDFKLPVSVPLTVGGIVTFAQWKYTVSMPTVTGVFPNISYGSKDYEFKWNNIGVGARGMYHFNFVKNLDTYARLTLGYVIQTFEGEDIPGYEGLSFFLFGANFGARYFFSKTIGAYLEVGYSGLQFASVGLTAKL